MIVLTCRGCNAPVVDGAKHRAWHQGVVCDCGHGIKNHPGKYDLVSGRIFDPCATCDCPEWKPRLRERVA